MEDAKEGLRHTLIAYLFDSHVVLRTHPQMLARFPEAFVARPALDQGIDALGQTLALPLTEVSRHPHHYLLQPADFNAPPLPGDIEMRRLEAADRPALESFLNRNSPDDIEEADITRQEHDPVIVGGFFGDEMVAYASFRFLTAYGGEATFGDQIGDVGVLIHPRFRSRGLGAAVVAFLTEWCLGHGIIPQYQAQADHIHSRQIPLRLGYTPLINLVLFKTMNKAE